MRLLSWENGRDRENHAENHVEDNEKFMKFALSDDIISVSAVGEKRRLLKERRGDCNQRQ